MTIFLRNSTKQTVADIEINEGKNGIDIRVAIPIKPYSILLLGHCDDTLGQDIINDFEKIQDLRQWFWEVYMEENDSPSSSDVAKAIMPMLERIAIRYGLNLIN